MHFFKLSLGILSIGSLSPSVFAVSDAFATLITHTDAVGKQIEDFGNVISGLNGGVLDFIPIATSLYGLQQAKQTTMQTLNQCDDFTHDQAGELYEHGEAMNDAVLKTLNAVAMKADSLDSLGLKTMAGGLLYGFSFAMKEVQETIKSKMPTANQTLVDSRIKTLGDGFSSAMNAFF